MAIKKNYVIVQKLMNKELPDNVWSPTFRQFIMVAKQKETDIMTIPHLLNMLSTKADIGRFFIYLIYQMLILNTLGLVISFCFSEDAAHGLLLKYRRNAAAFYCCI
ncbi:hypothetical protein BDF20DRAFT_839512 [Mycotypha africana]|uniref:uncharacterized protein n=1 Tax=Mycotypha africana TaxID=64632 RepID=UPI002301CD56|nr:uncharacterized protein BDF20DRAFT_839512 [Mycotypha africana]KAI8968404.1 hypothetical protein BDF20DRAFT_839512 [Mycotypha africana]